MRIVPGYVTNVLNKFSSVIETPTGWKAPCPCPNHGKDGVDTKPSLRITIGKDGKILLNCRVGCSLEEILKSISLNYKLLFVPPGEIPAKPLTVSPVTMSGEEVIFRDKVYREFLKLLNLSNEDKQELLSRGLSDFEIGKGDYRTLYHADRMPVMEKLHNQFGDALYTVPGFPIPEFCVGLVIPVKDVNSKIRGLKSRRKSIPKYVWFTSPELNPGTPCQVPTWTKDKKTVRVTEGELKAHVATFLSNKLTIGVSGVQCWKDSLSSLAALEPTRVLVAMDARDVQTREQICQSTLDFVETLLDLGYEVGLEEWDGTVFKGIDDALLGKAEITTSYGEDALTRLTSLWKYLIGVYDNEGSFSVNDRKPFPFPLEVFPQGIRTYIEKSSEQLQTPPDWIATGILVAAGRAIGTTRSILLDVGYEEMGNLYAIVVGPPGTLKSAAMDFAFFPIIKQQEKLSLLYEKEKEAYRKYNYIKKLAKEGNASWPKEDVPPPKPLEHLYTDNFTNEAVISRLSVNGKIRRCDTSIAIVNDEIKSWILGFNMYRGGKGADKQFFLSGWSRKTYKYDRKGDEESIIIPNPFICVYGGIQPDVLPCLEDDSGLEDGFLHRILFSFPVVSRSYRPPKTRPRPTKHDIDGESPNDLETSKQNYETVINRLLIGCRKNQDLTPKVVEFTEDAWKKWLDWLHDHADETDLSPLSFRGVWSKLRAYAGRFVLILHMLRVASKELGAFDDEHQCVMDDGFADVLDVENALKLVEYFKAHYKDVAKQFAYGPDDRRLEEFIFWVNNDCQGEVLLRQIYKDRMFGCKGKSDAEKLCRIAADRNLGHYTTKKVSGKDTPIFISFKPKLYEVSKE